jgi:hypothetical protein
LEEEYASVATSSTFRNQGCDVKVMYGTEATIFQFSPEDGSGIFPRITGIYLQSPYGFQTQETTSTSVQITKSLRYKCFLFYAGITNIQIKATLLLTF